MKTENEALKEIALKHDPKGYARMMAIKSIKDAIVRHQSKKLRKGQNALPSGTIDVNGFHPNK